MIHAIEIGILNLLSWYFSTPAMYGLPVFAIGLALFAVQWFNKSKIVPGAAALILLLGEVLHWIDPERLQGLFSRSAETLSAPGPHVAPFNFLVKIFAEPIFAIFVGSQSSRWVHQEIFFVMLCTYLGLMLWHSWQEYKRSGVVFGDLSISSVVSTDKSRPKRSDSNELGSGDLASAEEIARWTKINGKGDTSLMVKDLRGSEGGIVFKNARLVWPKGERNRHILAIAKTGSGKTSKLILPVLYNDCLCTDRSTIVIDSKPEMWRKLALMTKKYNPKKRVLLFNPLDKVRSLSWNILSKIEDETDCKLIANTIVMATDNPQSKSDSPFFRNNALSLLNSIMVGLLTDPEETLSMPRVHELVQSGMKPLCDWLEAHPNAFRTARAFVELARSGSQNADTIMSELAMRISAWDLSDIRATTAVDEFDIECLIKEPTLLVLEFRESELEMLRPLANVIVIELLRFLTKRAESCPGTCLPRPVGFVIDEFASALGRLPDIHVKLNTLRSRNVSIVAAIQSIGQVKANYGDDADSVLAGFSTKIFMPALDIQDAEWASKETGQMTIRFEVSSSGSNKKMVEWFASNNVSSQEQVQQRAVLTPDEIGRPGDNRLTFFMPNTAPFQGFIVAHFEQAEMLARISEFDKEGLELVLREKPIEYAEDASGRSKTSAPIAGAGGAAAPAAAAANNGLPPGISDTRGWTNEQVLEKLTECKNKLDWENTTGSARKWWEAFESENTTRMALVLRLAEELTTRNATITEFFLAYVYSNTDNIQANLHYLDYSRLKKEEEKRKREASAAATGANPAEQAKQAVG